MSAPRRTRSASSRRTSPRSRSRSTDSPGSNRPRRSRTRSTERRQSSSASPWTRPQPRSDRDAAAYRRLVGPLLHHPDDLIAEVLGPAHLPRHPLLLARFGVPALIPATVLGHAWFRGERARALLAGCAAHSILPLTRPVSAAVALLFLVTGHVETWPVAQGGSASITSALAAYLARSAAPSRPGSPSVPSRISLPRASCSSTPAPTRSRPSHRRCSPPATSGSSAATGTDPGSSRSTGRSTAPSRGPIPPASSRRRSTSAARSTRSRPRKPPSGVASTPTGPS